MRRSLLAIVVLLGVPTPAFAASGGTTYPDAVGGAAYGSPSTSRPTIGRFSVPTKIREGTAPSIRFRVDEPGERAVRVRIAVLPLGSTSGKPLSFEVGRRTVGRVHTVHWHGQGALAAGRYLVRLHAVDDLGRTLLRGAHASGRATLTVTPRPKSKKKATPTPAPTPTPTPAPAASTAPPPGPSSPTAGPITSGVFPVAGAHSYGDPFGSPRPGYTHQGQDVPAAEGTQVVAPTAGTITTTGYQASAAGYWILEHSSDGRDFFFAHCQASSFSVTQGATVAAGAPLCRVGHTGDATGPHLHFEIWVGGYRVGNGAPIDPLPQLKAWDGA